MGEIMANLPFEAQQGQELRRRRIHGEKNRIELLRFQMVTHGH
jgi:hypothetical protein